MNFYSNMIKFADERTADVLSNKTFDQLLIHPEVINRIKKCNYQLPTPVQAGAIPLGLLGNDLLVQAKSGTGKTLVFATLVANAVMETRGSDVVAVIIAPVREIAYQIKDVIDQLTPSETRTCVFIGGEDVKDNKSEIAHGCSVAIGTPGRIAQLVRDGILSFKQSKLFVLDEADKLMESTFTDDIKLIYNALNPETTQVTAFSATYPNDFDKYLSGFMKSPISYRIDSQDVQLLGIYQYAVVGLALRPVDIIKKLLEEISYAQSVIFTNQSEKCVQVSNFLSDSRFKVAAISGNFTQEERKKVINDLKNFALRIMVSTDLTARGIDAPNVNLVINVGVPASLETYLHRIGRAGRYGGNGASITILTTQQEVANFVRMTSAGGLNVKYLDILKDIPYDLTYNANFNLESLGFIDSCNKVVADVKADVARSEEVKPTKVGLTQYSNNGLLKLRSNSFDEMQSFKTIVNNCENNDVIASPSPVEVVSQTNSLSVAPQDVIGSTPVSQTPSVSAPLPSTSDVQQSVPETNVVEAESSNSEVFVAESPKKSASSSSFIIPARPDPWSGEPPQPRLSTDTTTPLPIVNADAVRQFIPSFEQDIEADIAKAKAAAEEAPPVPDMFQPPASRGRGGFGSGFNQETNGFNSHRGGAFSGGRGSFNQGFTGEGQENSGFGSQRSAAFGGGRGGRGGFNQSSSGDGQDNSGFGSNRNGGGRGGRRSDFGGDFTGNNQDNSGFGSNSRGGFGGRGGFNQTSGDGQDNSGFGSNRNGVRGGRRGDFGGDFTGNNQDNSGFGSNSRGGFGGGGGRGGFNQSSSADGQQNAAFGSSRSGAFSGGRGAFNQSSSGDGGFGRGGRGGFNQSSSGDGGFGFGGRGGFNQSSSGDGAFGRGGRGGFNQNTSGDGQDSSGFGSNRGDGGRGGRGGFGGRGGTFSQSSFGDGQDINSSTRGGRGGFSGNNQESSGFSSRGSFGQNDGNQEGSENVLIPGRRFQPGNADSLPSPSMAEKIAALKNKSFGKTMGGEAFSQKQFSPIIIHNTNAETVEDVNVVCPQSPEASVENLTANIEKLTVESVNESITAYSSREMLSIRDSKSSEDWIFYARMKSEWDTKNSPFEFDSELKVPFELQLRVLRTRESEKLRQRQEMLGIVKPKKMEKEEEKIKTVFPSAIMGYTTTSSSLNKDDCRDLGSFFKRLNDYCKNFKNEKHIGPAVFSRPSTQTSNISYITQLLDFDFIPEEDI